MIELCKRCVNCKHFDTDWTKPFGTLGKKYSGTYHGCGRILCQSPDFIRFEPEVKEDNTGKEYKDPLGPAKGILLALLISSVLWYVIYHLIALVLWLRGGEI